MRHGWGLALLAGLMGCATAPPPRYYTLDMRPSGQTPVVNIQVDRLTLAEPLSRPEIYIQSGATTVEYYASDTWVGNLADLIEEKLAVEFGPHDSQAPLLVLRGTIQAFGQIDTPSGAEAYIKLDVELRTAEGRRGGAPLLYKTYEDRAAAASATVGDVVIELSRGVERIAAAIASDARSLPRD